MLVKRCFHGCAVLEGHIAELGVQGERRFTLTLKDDSCPRGLAFCLSTSAERELREHAGEEGAAAPCQRSVDVEHFRRITLRQRVRVFVSQIGVTEQPSTRGRRSVPLPPGVENQKPKAASTGAGANTSGGGRKQPLEMREAGAAPSAASHVLRIEAVHFLDPPVAAQTNQA